MLRAYAAALLTLSLIVPHVALAAACPDPLDDPSVVQTLAALYGEDSEPAEADSDDEEGEDAVPQPDTTIAVQPGVSLVVENFGGSISVKTWDKDALKIAAHHSVRDRIMIERTGSTITLRVRSSRRWVPSTVQYRIVAPRWMKLELSGVNTDIDVENSHGEVRAETVQGDITLKGSEGLVFLSSVQGEIVAVGVRGRIEASSVNQAVRLANVVGPIFAESVNGGIVIEGSQSDSVEASTVNGPVTFEGRVSDQGFYRFATHNGCIDVAMPERSNATVSLSTFSGGIDSSFPVTLKKIRSRRFQTTLGSGLARFELESFQGTIFLRRPEEARSQCDSDSESDEDEDTKSDKHHKADKADKGDNFRP